MASADPEIRTLAASIAANTDLASIAGNADALLARTEKARRSRWAKYLAKVDPHGTMTDADRERAAKHALRADMARLSLIAVKARKELADLASGTSSRAS